MAATDIAEDTLATQASAQVDLGQAARLRRAILSRRARVGVVGMGYVGLPLAVSFAEAGYEVLGFEIDADRVAALNRGLSHIGDVPSAARSGVHAPGLPLYVLPSYGLPPDASLEPRPPSVPAPPSPFAMEPSGLLASVSDPHAGANADAHTTSAAIAAHA